jgi:hypothetical protein
MKNIKVNVQFDETENLYEELQQYINEIYINHNLDPCMLRKEHETIEL